MHRRHITFYHLTFRHRRGNQINHITNNVYGSRTRGINTTDKKLRQLSPLRRLFHKTSVRISLSIAFQLHVQPIVIFWQSTWRLTICTVDYQWTVPQVLYVHYTWINKLHLPSDYIQLYVQHMYKADKVPQHISMLFCNTYLQHVNSNNMSVYIINYWTSRLLDHLCSYVTGYSAVLTF